MRFISKFIRNVCLARKDKVILTSSVNKQLRYKN